VSASKIEWTDYTFNPWWGCEKVSPGCAHCYADTLATRYGHGGTWGAGHGFRFFGDKHWSGPLKWNAKAERERRRFRVFCASMADVFEERRELDEHRERLFLLAAETPHLDWQILTKRPEFARDFFGNWEPLPNLWVGVSIENARHTWRADVLREIPAAVRFISAEPLLGSLFNPSGRRRVVGPDLGFGETTLGYVGKEAYALDLTGIDWIIVGGESGAGARPFHLEHAREIVRACLYHCADCAPEERPRLPADRPAVFVKQLGAKPVAGHVVFNGHANGINLSLRDRKGGNWDEWPADLRIREFPTSATP
jgi:protein gp37